ncbi:ABC transporter substrate-binding protein [Brevundimonas sp. MEB006b]|uniref:ABC transporter substrate-binding protein n=1 Tax=Brevundimonas sp. MEB006b TaxID=3040283 RepID=UPI00254BB5D9|nr:ABC transporter substrate-binding protein [Brevundimonas sp. MEB006b]
MALDQCADQYVLALAPDADLALSPRADDPDAWLRRQAVGDKRLRPTLEAAVGFQPDVVVRYWGGEPRLLSALTQRGVKVVTIDDAIDLEGVRRNIRTVARDLGQAERGQALERQMDGKLAKAAPVKRAAEAPGAVYLTSGGFTAGPGTLIDAMMRAAGFLNLSAAPGFGALSVERIAMNPPVRFVLGFFDQLRADLRGPGRHPVVARAAEGRTAARLPAATLTCPAWFAADAVEMMAKGRP